MPETMPSLAWLVLWLQVCGSAKASLSFEFEVINRYASPEIRGCPLAVLQKLLISLNSDISYI